MGLQFRRVATTWYMHVYLHIYNYRLIHIHIYMIYIHGLPKLMLKQALQRDYWSLVSARGWDVRKFAYKRAQDFIRIARALRRACVSRRYYKRLCMVVVVILMQAMLVGVVEQREAPAPKGSSGIPWMLTQTDRGRKS